jgi:hypothetical protein
MLDILTTIASLASIASLAIQVGIPGSPDFGAVLRNLRSRLTGPQQAALDTPGAEELIILLIIDPDLLDDLKKSIEHCVEQYRRAIRGGKTRSKRDVIDHEAERCVCENLNRLKRRNGGKLPDGKFSDWWESYRCEDDYDF